MTTPQRISEIFARPHLPMSFEIFPPKGELADDDARKLAGELCPLSPDFISVTHSAGGSGNADSTAKVANLIQREHGVTAIAHLTCASLTRAQYEAKVAEFRDAGIVNVLALRGDLRPGMEPGDFTRAADLIGALVADGFCVGAAAYPEGHIDCLDPDTDVTYLRAKQDAGASFLVTQLFFDNDAFYRFRERCGRTGIDVPITCGIMPFMTKNQVQRMIFMCAASLPAAVIKLLARYEDQPEALREAGIEYAAHQLTDLKANGVDGLHIYSMNKPRVARALIEAIR